MQLSLISGLSKREIKDNFSLFARMLLVSIVARSRCSTPVCTQQQDQEQDKKEKEKEKEAERLYEERIEEEYAKREGGA